MNLYFKPLLLMLMLSACAGREAAVQPEEVLIQHGKLSLQITNNFHTRVSSTAEGASPLMEAALPSEYLITKKFRAQDFMLDERNDQEFTDEVGKGQRWTLKGSSKNGDSMIEKVMTVKAYDAFPDMLLMQVMYINRSSKTIQVNKWVNHHYKVLPHQDSTLFWSFQGGSTSARKDWIQPLKPGFSQENYMGLSSSDYGGGIPVTNLWRPDVGIAIGHAELQPKLISLPVDIDQDETTASISTEFEYGEPLQLGVGDTLKTIETFVMVHQGDYYNSLATYGNLLRAKGLDFVEPEEAAYESSWCAWGYMRDFTLEEIIGTLPKVKELGIKWVTIDDGFQQAEGDWQVNRQKFPKGDTQMKALVDKIHSYDMKAMLWWAPLAADPGSKLLQEHPDMKLLNADGSPQYITWWDAYYMSPAYKKTIQHTEEVVDLFMNQWGFDGLKMDGQHLNAVPPDYNPAHNLEHPEESVEKLPQFFAQIYENARDIKPNAVIQNCPCGTCMSVFNMPYMNQAVASDPLSSWQIRHKGKTYKALLGKTAYFGDHVELSDERSDFASSFGIGAVLGTKFTWPRENPTVTEDNLLTPEREIIWKKWFGLYHQKMLSKESYLGGLYDIGWELPETHVIQKGDTLHYAFYNQDWEGTVRLKGLQNDQQYRVRDYVKGIDLGVVTGPEAELPLAFKKNLLIEVYPEN
ncbi:glycoside hydrolase family 36 protein [Cesiribacter sp. SM1]|uniref:glycoside hydrolase family 36 protein n=1 Tax=Cesiribacter sp. SM1 TaxID=2861196 RepID=UPI001CD379C2|nr:glycoside hydrolase family 36 protein [Cesiribacter sp. SM1]